MKTVGSIAASLQEIRRYYRCFGLIDGITFYRRSKSPGRLLRLGLKRLSAPIFLRSGTSDIAVARHVLIDCAHNPLALDQEPATIVDLGANIGIVAVHYANLYPKAIIIAVEPDPENFALLLKNTKAYENIRPVQAAVWSSNARLQIEDKGRDFWGRTVSPANMLPDVTITVPGITIPELMRQFSLASIDLLKIDIEGSEKEIFNSQCLEWLSATNAILIELHDRFVPGSSNAFFKAIVNRPFTHSHLDEYVFVRFTAPDVQNSQSANMAVLSSPGMERTY